MSRRDKYYPSVQSLPTHPHVLVVVVPLTSEQIVVEAAIKSHFSPASA
ncbi:hypothetical protein [Methermicoccus shengliensis]|uniref:Uncharacterized protein n=1 Tax=Methermicoccus shengliensis TaxID=660064 RepID=A0A832RTE8_9EURY|nr:hypothetical protein [Methermicoccus shengliensis]KUK04603.1 MAG: hypothetical protein XD46_0714 [Euryarchaeota archaeon 55_53]KUK29991.1 MAG: hypothetical protein XD62_0933 [Methanosarcinales archeaon 56_1174]MDI3488473.1 hypothetical protein [Methanosarcinales archaeon]MDN5294931.1 hypothetical protein [Methanosarcinales archaeon]HIH70123.1 hypothetical protein [Methermicoccus shengliensis]